MPKTAWDRVGEDLDAAPAKPKKVRKPKQPPSEDTRSVREKIDAGAYVVQLQWPRHGDRSADANAQRAAYQAEQGRLTEMFKQDVFREHNVLANPKRELCFEKAWSHGHAAGYHEVLTYFEDFVDLIV